ncbi:unnamed protein product [Camellia sinensis]|uniref:sec-independent protein translocase protein TATA, chloroplastic n=1 Tax=Camellia sinensis TaxID=4442 RepID=UPI001036F01F|nr:sec-independent protein translocase protein TATA, chloroplastic [Camellia sinensis]
MEMAISIPSATFSPSPICRTIPRTTITNSPSLSFTSSKSSFFNNTLTHQNIASSGQVQGRTRTRTRTRSRGLSCTCLFGLGVPELVVIAGVAALVFGPKKLPEVGRSIGKTVKSFQQAAKEFETELKKEPGSTTEPPVEKPTAAIEEEKEVKVSSTKESL